jgi:hypothetical protein
MESERLETIAKRLEAAADRIHADQALGAEEREALDVLRRTLPTEAELERTPATMLDSPWRRVLALAALVILVAGGWLLVRTLWPPGGPGRGGALVAQAVRSVLLSPSPEPLRAGSSQTEFRSDEEVYVHAVFGEHGTAFVAFLGANGVLSGAGEPAAQVAAGTHSFGPFELDADVGRESFVVLWSPKPLGYGDFEAIVAEVAAATKGRRPEHTERIQAVVAAFRARGVDGLAVSFEHVR